MRDFIKYSICGISLILSAQTAGASVVAYPEKGQSEKQQQKDKYECYEWAKNQTGIDPQSSQETASTAGQQPQGGAVRGAGKGAAAGAIGGAVVGDAGKGAAAGATIGAIGGASRRRQQEREQSAQQEQAQAQQQEKVAAFDKAQSVCLKGRGYSVE